MMPFWVWVAIGCSAAIWYVIKQPEYWQPIVVMFVVVYAVAVVVFEHTTRYWERRCDEEKRR